VLAPLADLDDPASIGPYCDECWPNTVTARESARRAEAPPTAITAALE